MNSPQDTPPDIPYPFPPDAAAVELAVGFIEADPAFAGADLMKEKLARHLESAYLTGDQRNRLAAVLLRSLRHGSEPVFRAYARLAPAVASPLFDAAVTCYAASCEYPVADRAKCVLGVLGDRRSRSAPSHSGRSAGRWFLAARVLTGPKTAPDQVFARKTAQFYLESRRHFDTFMLRSRRDFTVASVHGAGGKDESALAGSRSVVARSRHVGVGGNDPG